MAVTVWKGHLTFGLVSIPVRLMRAARRERISLHQLHRRERPSEPEDVESEPDYAPSARSAPISAQPAAEPAPVERVRQGLFTQEGEPPIPRGEIVKGYEFEKDRYVVIEKDDIDRIAPKTSTEMQIVEFVKLAEIDPIFFETSYYVAPDGAGEKPYVLLLQALRESGYVALAEFAMRRRQHAVVIRPGATGIVAHTMFYPDEVRKGEEFRADTGLAGRKELDLAITLIQAMAVPFEPEKFKDTFLEKLGELIAAKLKGEQVAAAPAISKTAPAVDIMQALQASLAAQRKPVASEPGKRLKPGRKAGGR